MNILALSDLHFRRPWYAWVLDEAERKAWDLIVIAGDLLDQFNTRCGTAEQAERKGRKRKLTSGISFLNTFDSGAA